ncbi:NUDIX domain-containing protein [Pseudarcicella hirudinis]|uniref:NUDIX domain-containing protein n=1 Tax=Pseudarcicella hirudinis TaxID=1079859 RepID=A0A1I5UWB7_9BACT|nr:NUDIX domain-containing protein [Pseudarcicella hirudinis]SFP99327.1 NUDIX domain-containing protein [Pseudarcicella hirudinis]
MNAEYFDVFDAGNKSLNFIKLREKVHQSGDWHRSVQVWVINEKAELLINLRHETKDVFPSLWDVSIAGHLQVGEQYHEAAVREVAEEIGLNIVASELKQLDVISVDGFDVVNDLYDREHVAVFVLKTTRKTEEFKMQETEISMLKFADWEFVKTQLRSDTPELHFIPLQKVSLSVMKMIENQGFV